MTPKELRKLHKLHCGNGSVQYDVILERLADGWTEKQIIQKPKRKSGIKYSNRNNLTRKKPPMRQHLIYHIKVGTELFDYIEQDKEGLIKYMIRKDGKQIIECEKIEEYKAFVSTLHTRMDQQTETSIT